MPAWPFRYDERCPGVVFEGGRTSDACVDGPAAVLLHAGDAVDEGALGRGRRRDAPVGLLIDVEPDDRADPSVRVEVVEHLLDPQRLVAPSLDRSDLADLHGFVRRDLPHVLQGR